MAPYQRRIVLALFAIMIIGLSLKMIERHRQVIGSDIQAFLDGYKYTTGEDSSSVELNVVSNVASLQQQTDSAGVTGQPNRPSININTANAEELMLLPGIGPVLAAEIVAHRNIHGLFRTPEDLLAIKGIGPSKLSKIREFVEF